MGCACEIELDGNGPSCFKSSDRKARKEHKCCECHRVILPGETYRYESGVWDGDPEDYKTCADCLSVRDEFFCSYVYGQIWEGMHELINESDGELSFAKLANVTTDARDRICGIWEDWHEEYEFNHPLRVAMRLDARMQTVTVIYGKFKVYEYARKEWVMARMKDVEAMTNAYEY